MRQRTSLLIIFSLLLIPLLCLPFTSALDVAKTKPIISGNNLDINWIATGSGECNIDNSPAVVKSWITYEPTQVDENHTLMWATVVFGFQTNFYTKYSITDAYNKAVKVDGKVKYLTVQTCTSPTLTSTYGARKDFFVNVPQYDLGDYSIKAKGFSGNMKPEAKLISLTPRMLDFGTVQYEFKTTEFIGVPTRISMVNNNWNWTEIGKSNNIFIPNAEPITVGTQSISADAVDPYQYGAGATSVNNALPALGIKAIQQYPTNEPGKGQEGKHSASGEGTSVMKSGLQLEIRPDIRAETQWYQIAKRDYMLVDKQKDLWDTQWGVIESKSDPIIQDKPTRVIGWSIQNYMVGMELEVEMDVYSTVEIGYDTSTRARLQKPDLYLADTYWDTIFTGQGGVIPVQDQSPADLFWEQYGTYIIIGVIAAVTIYLIDRYKDIILAYKAGKGDK